VSSPLAHEITRMTAKRENSCGGGGDGGGGNRGWWYTMMKGPGSLSVLHPSSSSGVMEQ